MIIILAIHVFVFRYRAVSAANKQRIIDVDGEIDPIEHLQVLCICKDQSLRGAKI